ncbi:alpha/beta hydrolase [Aureibaculum sp. 2210JD6-5]|uniref:serine aminopeptidase domain-containing protein n=1 Tax=Aureibaculum sp. 2210JD6-5 TaxID=3103957 RepID=UPI002AAC82CF|nr:alpha/beta hydrolase [Aureibaculum sp. 2210JD6-5]MDY7395409.1 alpha/beta hydrolase [Aureibaculum sp. 2210JD6-5]
MRFYILFIGLFYISTIFAQDSNTITFYAKDSVVITADTYFIEDVPPTVLLCHQAGYSRGEYINTAKKLNELGFSCMAIDQRSGKRVNGIINQTAIDADSKLRNVGYAGAKQDVEAAIDYLYNMNGNQPLILVGSSYSASLALWIGSENDKIKTVVAFSPGEYLKGINLAETIKPLKIPVFVTSSKREITPVEKLVSKVKPDLVTQYKPKVKGFHGSKALWDKNEGHQKYWDAFKAFLLEQK